LEDLTRRAEAKLWSEDGRGRDYLFGRGLTEDSIRRARLGYIPPAKPYYLVHNLKVFPGIVIPSSYQGQVEFLQFRNIWAVGKEDRYRSLGPARGTLFLGDCLRPFEAIHLFEGAFDALIAQQLGANAATLQHYRSKLRRLDRAFQGRVVADIDTQQLRLYILDMRNQTQRYVDAPQKPVQPGGLSHESVNTHIRVLHRFFRWSAEEYAIPNPMHKIRYPQPQTGLPKGIHPETVIRLLQACPEDVGGIRDKALVAFLADTGCRLGGLVGLKTHNLELDRLQAVVTEKGNKTRLVRYTKFTAQVVKRWLEHRHSPTPFVFINLNTHQGLTASGISVLLKRLRQRTGVNERTNPHSFRHGFAKEFVISGGSILVLSKLLGHTNINTTAAFYALFSEEELLLLHNQHSPLRDL
jgi:integrase/recombinase XerD